MAKNRNSDQYIAESNSIGFGAISETSSLLNISQNSGSARRKYEAPVLTQYGDVRDITMGPTVGFGESGGGPFCAEFSNCP